MAQVNEERVQATEQLQRVLAATTGTAEHHTGLATVTATAQGDLRALHLHPALLAQGPQAVGQVVVETARQATDVAVQLSYNSMAKSLGDGMAMLIEGIAGDAPFRSAGAAPAPPPPPPPPARRPRPPVDDDEDDFFADPFGRR